MFMVNFRVMSKCCICEADIQDMPFTLPCSHIICKKCYYQLIKNKHTCEVCGAEIPVDLKQGDLVNRYSINIISELFSKIYYSSYTKVTIISATIAKREPWYSG